MRQIILDLETTGLETAQGHRIVEFYGLEMVNRRLTQEKRQYYFNPERSIDQEAQLIHGLSVDFLKDKPTFENLANEIIDFIKDAELIIHNASFDVGFLNAEFSRLNLPPVEELCAGVIDTLHLAREAFPGKRNNLDALCDRFNIDRSERTLHSASIDCELLSKVYLLLTRGQENLIMSTHLPNNLMQLPTDQTIDKLSLIIRYADEKELALHQEYLSQLGNHSVWCKSNNKEESVH